MTDLEKTCRACLQHSKDLINFQENLTKSTKVFECFQNLTLIMIKADEKDSKICKKCLKILKIAADFKEQCLRNDDKFRDLVRGEMNQNTTKLLAKWQLCCFRPILENPDPQHNRSLPELRECDSEAGRGFRRWWQ
jgi:hypothetical protein